MFSPLNRGQFFALSRPLKVLVIKLDHLGDFLLALPALHALMDKLGPCELDLIVGSWNVSLAKKVPGIQQVFSFDFFKTQSKLPPELKNKALTDLLAQLPEYDIALDFRRFEDTRFLLAKLKARYKIAYESFDGEIDAKLDCVLPSSPNHPNTLTPSNQIHTSIQMLRLVEAIPFRLVKNPPLLAPTPKAQAIGIFPFAGQPTKEWPLDRFKAIIEKLSQAYPSFTLNIYITPDRAGDFDAFKGHSQIHCHTNLSIPQVLEHATENQLILANDSFGAHLAYHVGASLVAIYSGVGPMQEFCAAFGSFSLLTENVSCAPCHLPNKEACPYELKCLNNLSVEQVFNAIQAALEMKTPPENQNLYYFL